MSKSKKYIIATIFLILTLVFVIIWISYFFVETTYFEYKSPKLQEKVRAVVLADLHGHEFGEFNEKLISKVEEEDPDVILIVGDMLNDTSDDSHVAVDVTRGLSQIAPVYYAIGNHEIDYIEFHGEELLSELGSTGAEILEMESRDIEVNGQKIRIGGMYAYAFAMDAKDSTIPENMIPEVYEFLMKFEDTDALKIMLAHRPDSFIYGDAPKTRNVDLVISAHNHGGQVILPLFGGLYGGDQGWFPDYVYGMHSFEKFNMLITRGLGSNPKVLPRFNNRPEVMVLEMGPEE